MRKYKKKLFVIMIILIICLLSPMYTLKNYGILLEADELCIYKGSELVTTVKNPAYMLDTFKGTVGIYVVDESDLGINRFNMKELYRLEFLDNNKIISSIKILTPKTKKGIDKINRNNGINWRKINGDYVVLYENTYYFLFGDKFFENLSQILNES